MGDPSGRAAISQVRGVVFDIQRYSLHDGPGLRTNVFLKGCTLACEWCSNPESQARQPEIAFFERNCFLCGDCIGACPQEGIAQQGDRLAWERQACTACGRCVQVCPSGAFRLIGEERTAGEVIEQVLRDVPFYGEGGGLTLTGGEPALQAEFTAALLRLAKSEGLHTAMETCGQVPWEHYAACLPHLDLLLFDLKHTDPQAHRLGTRAGNGRILENLGRLARRAGALVIRVPLIPGFNADDASLAAIAAYVSGLETVKEVHLLPYHTLARSKYKALHRAYTLDDLPPMRPEQAEQLGAAFRQRGLKVVIGG